MFFRPRLNIHIFLPILGWKYSCIILKVFAFARFCYLKKKEFVIILFFRFSSCLLCWILLIRITCTVHQTVISVEHFAVASAGFFVLLASFAVQRKEEFYTVKLKQNCIVFTSLCFITQDYQYICPFKNISLGFILKIFLKCRNDIVNRSNTFLHVQY